MAGGTLFYIDALNFYYGAVKGTADKWVDFKALAQALVPRDHIGRIKYFTANVKPLSPGDRTHERQNAFLRAVDTNPLIEIVRGHFRSDIRLRALAERKYAPEQLFVPALEPTADLTAMLLDAQARRAKPATMARVVIPEEKGSDVNLGTHLLYDALKGHFDKAIVVTNDSDLSEPIRLAVSEGIPVGIVNPHRNAPTNIKLAAVASFEIPPRQVHQLLPDAEPCHRVQREADPQTPGVVAREAQRPTFRWAPDPTDEAIGGVATIYSARASKTTLLLATHPGSTAPSIDDSSGWRRSQPAR